MTCAVRGLGLVFGLVFVSAIAGNSLAQSDSQAAAGSTTTSTAAYVYIQIQGPEGAVYGFRASSGGQLSTIPGSPFKPAGEIVGATPTKFFTLGKDLIHSYNIDSNGAVGSQLSQIPFFDYSGNECDPSHSSPAGAVLDHTGKYIYVALNCGFANLSWFSTEYQTYRVQGDGSFSYDGDTDLQGSDAPSILGNERFAYANGASECRPIGFRRETNGTLELMQFTETDPAGYIPGGYCVFHPDASPSGNYLVLQLCRITANFACSWDEVYYGSYTVASNGDISTTNTWGDMPLSSIADTTFSPSGDLFVANSYNGIEIYKFNGAAPLTLWQTLLPNRGGTQLAFDRSNHLYATLADRLYVFTVTPTSVAEDSSWPIATFKMVVVSK